MPSRRETPLPAKAAGQTRPRVSVELAAQTHVGLVRPRNEDHHFVARGGRSLEAVFTNVAAELIPAVSREDLCGYIVADGVGGGRAGDVASRMAIETLVDLWVETPDWIFKPTTSLIPELLRRQEARFHAIRNALIEKSEKDPALDGMGTTLTVVLTQGLDLIVAHVGDSRAYILRDGNLIRLTRDQTLAQAFANAGWISQARVETHPDRHILLQAIDAHGGEMVVDVGHVTLQPGDAVILCTDGLTNMVPERRIASVAASAVSAAAAAAALVDLALEAGGSDNVTVVIGRYSGG